MSIFKKHSTFVVFVLLVTSELGLAAHYFKLTGTLIKNPDTPEGETVANIVLTDFQDPGKYDRLDCELGPLLDLDGAELSGPLDCSRIGFFRMKTDKTVSFTSYNGVSRTLTPPPSKLLSVYVTFVRPPIGGETTVKLETHTRVHDWVPTPPTCERYDEARLECLHWSVGYWNSSTVIDHYEGIMKREPVP